jgi:hypothetical protein
MDATRGGQMPCVSDVVSFLLSYKRRAGSRYDVEMCNYLRLDRRPSPIYLPRLSCTHRISIDIPILRLGVTSAHSR